MKKKFAASLVAMALAMSMPMGALAFAAEGDVPAEGGITVAPVPDEDAPVNQKFTPNGDDKVNIGSTVTEIQVAGDIVKKDGEADVAITSVESQDDAVNSIAFGYAIETADMKEKMIEDQKLDESDPADKAQIDAFLEERNRAWEDAERAYERQVKDIVSATDEKGNTVNKQIADFVINGTLNEGGSATVSVITNDGTLLPGDHVTVVILHDDGTVETQVVALQADGTNRTGGKIVFKMDNFSYVQAFYTPNAALTGGSSISPVPEDPAVTPDTPAADQPQGDNAADEAQASDAEKNLAELGDNPTEDGKSPKTGC